MKNNLTYDSVLLSGKIIDVNHQKLFFLPEISEEVEIIKCFSNNLKSLPQLPKNLRHLECDNNDLFSLPELPETLEYLNCSYNYLKELPKLPKNLHTFHCYGNPLQVLIPVQFYSQQSDFWLQPYLREIQTLSFQIRLLEKDPSQIEELIRRGILHPEIKNLCLEHRDLIESVEWGLV